MYTPLYQHARIVSAAPGTRIIVEHLADCPEPQGGHCRCPEGPTVTIVRPRPAPKAVRR